KHLKLTAFALAGAALLSACADDPVSPTLAPDLATFETSGASGTKTSRGGDIEALAAQVPAKQLVMFKGRAPADFEAQVAALVGTVTMNHPVGVRVVLGLDEEGASQRKATVKAQYVEPMQGRRLVEPPAATEPQQMAGMSMLLPHNVTSSDE